MNENGHVVNTIDREHTIAPVLKLPIEIIGYAIWNECIAIGVRMYPCVTARM